MAEQQGDGRAAAVQIALLSGSFFFLFLGAGAVQQFLLPVLATRAGTSPTSGAVVFACVYFGGPIFLSVYGFVYQALRERWCIVLGGLTYTLFVVAAYLVGVRSEGVALFHEPRIADVPLFILGAALLWGFGAQTIWATGPTQVINATHQSRYGSVAGLFQSATYSGQMLGVLLLGTILRSHADAARGQEVMLLAAIGITAVGNVLALGLRVKPREGPPAKLSDAARALQSLPGRYLVLLSVANYLGWGLVLSAFTTLVHDIGQEARLHWIVLPYYVGRLLVAWLAGHTSDRVGRERVMLAGFALGTAGLVAAALSPTAPVIAAVSAVLGMQAAMVAVASAGAVGDYIPRGERHLVFAGTNAWGYLAAGATMIVSQVLRARYADYVPSFLLFAAFYGGCAALVARMRAALRGMRLAEGE